MKNIYNMTEKLKVDFEGVNRGIQFINELKQELNNLKIIKDPKNLSQVSVLENSEYKLLRVDNVYFTEKLSNIYYDFLIKKYLMQFPWYKKFYNALDQMFELDFKLEIGSTRDKLLLNITRIFLIISDCNNVFDFKKTYDLMVEMFCVMGFEILFSDKISGCVFSKLIEKNLITVEYSYYGTKKYFSLSDRYFDVILGMISISLPPVFHISENSVRYSGNFGLKKLNHVIENYFNFFDSKDNFQEAKFVLFLKYPELATKLNNFNDVVIDFSCLDAENFEFRQSVFGMYYIKTRLNEYCFQTVAMSFFEMYYTADFYTTKNMLFSPSNFEFNLY